MRPLPTTSPDSSQDWSEKPTIERKSKLELGPVAPASNQKRTACQTQRAYPWLLGTSTLMAAAFCYLYLTKPVIMTGPSAPSETVGGETQKTPQAPVASQDQIAKTTPAETSFPGDVTSPKPVEPQALASTNGEPFEETNLKIQHVLRATGPNSENLGTVTLNVPVSYQSGNIRWTTEDVTQAHSLLARIEQYREKSRNLQSEAISLIQEWDDLMVRSIPDNSLRADSPTLPENQGMGTATAAPLKTVDTIEIEDR